MKTKIQLALFGLLLLVCATFARADSHPLFLNPAICTPPTPPAPGQPGYGPSNPLAGGIYYDFDTGLWNIPDSYWNFDGSDSDRDIAIVDIINDLMGPPPPPSWAISDPLTDGTYYWGGGYYNGHYFAAGYYLPSEIA
jgi:hypothetical protein